MRGRIADTCEHYVTATDFQPKCPTVVGDPGAGKTTVMQLSMVHTITRKLNAYMTTLMSKRAHQLGVIHLAELFCIPVMERSTPSQIAEIALGCIYNCAWKYEFLRTLDALGIDELGQLPAEIIAVADIIMRRLQSSTRFMGGLLLILTIDAAQLYPIKGMHPLLSSHVITCFALLQLEHSVRAAFQFDYICLQKITRLFPHQLKEDIKKEFIRLFCKCFQRVKHFHEKKSTYSNLCVQAKSTRTTDPN